MESKRISAFLELPAELRSRIYVLVFGGHVIHIGGIGHQPYMEGHLPDGRCSVCMPGRQDEEVYEKYTRKAKALTGSLPPERFSARHRDCHRYPVSHRLRLDFLTVCRQIYREAACVVFEENEFTLARPISIFPFLSRLNSAQMSSIRSLVVYSVESSATWIGPFDNYHLDSHLTGLRKLRIFVELRTHWNLPWTAGAEFGVTPEYLQDRRLSGLTMFRVPSLRQVDLMTVTGDWHDNFAENLCRETVDGIEAWEGRLKEDLLSPNP